jgi:hypothetical protein
VKESKMQEVVIRLAAESNGTVVATGGGNGATWTHIATAAQVVAVRSAVERLLEGEAILRIADRLGGKTFLDIAEAGTFDALRDLISEVRPHVVHLSGHGELADGVGRFCFEDERGRLDAREGREMAECLFAGSGVRLVFVSGCQSAQAGVAGLCQSLTADGHVVGQFLGPAPCPLGQVALGQGLNPPSDLANQMLLVPAAAFLAHDGGVPAAQFVHGHLLQDRDLGVDALGRFGPRSHVSTERPCG